MVDSFSVFSFSFRFTVPFSSLLSFVFSFFSFVFPFFFSPSLFTFVFLGAAVSGAGSAFSLSPLFVSCAQLAIRARDRMDLMARTAIEPVAGLGSAASKPLLPLDACDTDVVVRSLWGLTNSVCAGCSGAGDENLESMMPESSELNRVRDKDC